MCGKIVLVQEPCCAPVHSPDRVKRWSTGLEAMNYFIAKNEWLSWLPKQICLVTYVIPTCSTNHSDWHKRNLLIRKRLIYFHLECLVWGCWQIIISEIKVISRNMNQHFRNTYSLFWLLRTSGKWHHSTSKDNNYYSLSLFWNATINVVLLLPPLLSKVLNFLQLTKSMLHTYENIFFKIFDRLENEMVFKIRSLYFVSSISSISTKRCSTISH
jgi:hypothetical protein